ncbi:hypothetical protein ABTY59_32205 [Streptomyces sp. NPDC096079]|uniref:hypothetical protein n=1 Tax=Streptomyces sp. NPDC096079 TaxID=3155820 RepID=UPI003332C0B9
MTTAAAPPRTGLVIDLEGGLINVRSIRHLAKDAARFHEASLGCPPNKRIVADARRAHRDGLTVLVMTGGDRRLGERIVAWLGDNEVPAAVLLMRCQGDYRPGAVVKRERLRAARRRFADLTVWSADPSVTRLSERDGIAVRELPGYWGETQ